MARRVRNLLAAALAAATLAACGGAGRTRVGYSVAYSSPPSPRYTYVEPRPGYVWVDGYWNWDGYQWQWVEGYWVPQRQGYVYVQGGYDYYGGRYVYRPGRWSAQRDRYRPVYRYNTARPHYERRVIRPAPPVRRDHRQYR